MSTQFRSRLRTRSQNRSHRRVHTPSNRVVTLGELVTVAFEVAGSADGAAKLLSNGSPLSRMLGRRIVID